VGTVGKIAIQPGAYNVIPGKVVLGLEIRDLDAAKIEMLFAAMEKRAAMIAKASKTKISFDRQANESKPALTDKKLQQVINTTAKSLGFSTRFMQSGAGHDSQHIASIAPAAMIFIPSIGGISHSPKEFSTATDMENGANVLLQTILAIDKR
jgi:N-carbamoyl-L-amino-acid hydrolase